MIGLIDAATPFPYTPHWVAPTLTMTINIESVKVLLVLYSPSCLEGAFSETKLGISRTLSRRA